MAGMARGTAASVQQERYLQLEESFANHQRSLGASVQAGFSIGRRIILQSGHTLNLAAFKKAVTRVLNRSPILRCTFEEGKGEGDPPCDAVHPPYSSHYKLVPLPGDGVVDRFLHHHLVDDSCTDLTIPCTEWLLKPFERLHEPLLRVVFLRRGAVIEEVLLVGHRSILDAWSMEWVVQELVQVYEQLLSPQGADLMQLVDQLVEGGVPPSPPLSQTEEFRNAVSFWADRLSSAMPVLQVPTDRPRPQTVSMKQARMVRVLPGTSRSAAQLRRMAAQGCKWGVHDVLCATFVTWLHRLTAEKDVVVGVLANIRREGFESCVGPLTNRIPLRVDLDGGVKLPFRDVLSRVSTALREIMEHRSVEFEQIIECLKEKLTDPATGKEKTTLFGGSVQDQDADALSPMFKVMYMMESQLTPPLKRDLAWSTVKNLAVVGNALAPYDLTLRVNQRWDGGIDFVFLYNEQLFSKPFISELMNNYLLLLRQVLDDPSQGIYDYSLITPTARPVLPDPLAPQDEGWPGSLVNVFHRNAKKHPKQLAVSYESGVTLTYEELDVASSKLSHMLISCGVGKGDVVGIYGHRSPAVIVAILGIYKLGAAYSMMDPQYPSERIITCMKIAGIKGWVRIADAPEEASEVDQFLRSINLAARVVLPQPKTKEFASLVGDAPETLPPLDPHPDDTAVVTFTSGSTGVPKGVLGRQSSLTTFYPWLGETFAITPGDRFGMCSGIAHDPLQRDIFTPLFFGAAVYIPKQDTINTPGCLGRYMRAAEITVCCFTPALGQILVTVDEENFCMPALRFVMFVGDMLIKRDVMRLRKLAPNCRIINMWGTTETSRAVGYFDLLPETSLESLKEVIPCGKGMKDCQMLLLNPAGKLAGVGEAGEIYMRSCHLAKGYVGLEEETAKKFLQSPFSSNPRDRVYRSGDLGHYLADGTVECLGRVDDQIKIRGFRIELGEINAKLSRHELAKENVTVARKDPKTKENIIVSYVVPVAGASKRDPKELSLLFREFLKTKVPHYMVPLVMILPRMPLTPNAKVDTRALPPPVLEDEDTEESKAFESTLSPTEGKVYAIWRKHLRSRITSRDQSFFDLGGHSLLATTVTMEIMKAFDVKLPLNVLFANPTLEGTAAAVEDARGGRTASKEDVDLMYEADLPRGVMLPAAGGEMPPAMPRATFITGTPGFLATFVLRDILELTSGNVYCLVYARDTEQGARDRALQRIVHMLRGTLCWKEEYGQRIIPCLGDLSKPSLGLTRETWDELAHKVDLVIHAGAMVHWLHSYEQMKPANVNGTLEVLRLCCEDHLKTLAFVSTTNVYEAEYAAHDIIKETIPLSTGRGLTGGYTQSKWVADKMVMNAEAIGLPAMSLRPSFISGDSTTGAWTTDDFLVRLIKGCVQLKAYPIIPREKGIDMSPVDWVARAVTISALNPDCRGRNFNVVNSSPVPYQAVFDLLVEQGYPLEPMEYPKWRARLLEVIEKQETALSAIASHFTEGWADGLRAGQVHDSTEMQRVAAQAGLDFPDMHHALEQALGYLVESGFMEPPPSGHLNVKLAVPWKLLFERGEVGLITRHKRSTS